MIRYDAWCLHVMEVVLCWLKDWFSLSQQRVEVALIAVYVVAGNPGKFAWVGFLARFFAGCCMLSLLSDSSQELRRYRRYHVFYMGWRIALQVAGLVLIVSDVAATGTIWWAVGMLAYVVFFYAISIAIEGPGGRKRKLLWSTIKQWFGTAWLPPPEPLR